MFLVNCFGALKLKNKLILPYLVDFVVVVLWSLFFSQLIACTLQIWGPEGAKIQVWVFSESWPFSSVSRSKIWKDWNKFTLHTLRRWSALLRWSRAKLESPELENKQCIVSTNCLTWNNIRWISGWYWISLSSWEFWCVTLHVGWLRRETLGPWFKKIIYFFVIWIKRT